MYNFAKLSFASYFSHPLHLLMFLLLYSQHCVKLQDSSSDHASNQERFGYFSSLKNVSEIPNCFTLHCIKLLGTKKKEVSSYTKRNNLAVKAISNAI